MSAAATLDYPLMYNEILSSSSYSTYTSGIGSEGGGGTWRWQAAQTQAVLDELGNEIERLNQENAALRQRVQLLTHRLFGRRSEKGVPIIEQGVLPLEPRPRDQYIRKPPTNCRATKPPKVRCAGGATPVGVDCQLICHASVSR